MDPGDGSIGMTANHVGFRAHAYGELAAFLGGAPEAQPTAPPARPPAYPRTWQALCDLAAAFAASPRDTIASTYVRLFVNAPGGIPAPPYASYYLDGGLLGPSSTWVASEYARQALELAPDAGQPADFVASECEFLAFLARHQWAALAIGDEAARRMAAQAEERFFRQHLCLWLPQFARALRAAAPDGVFAHAADLLEALCLEEAERLDRAGV